MGPQQDPSHVTSEFQSLVWGTFRRLFGKVLRSFPAGLWNVATILLCWDCSTLGFVPQIHGRREMLQRGVAGENHPHDISWQAARGNDLQDKP